jgi:hypothetical protein
VGRDPSNSSQPRSTDGPGAKAKAKPGKRPAGRQSQQSPDGQPAADEPGRTWRKRRWAARRIAAAGLSPVATPDHREPVEPSSCAGCGAGLAGAPGQVASRVQVFDLPTFSLAVTEYLLMRRRCGCGHLATASPPAGVRGGPTCYGPNATAAATLLASQDVLGIERTADSCTPCARWAPTPAGGGPGLVRRGREPHQGFDQRVLRSSTTSVGCVRDDFGGSTSYDEDLAGVQQCLAHLLRYLDDAHAIDIDAHAWARAAGAPWPLCNDIAASVPTWSAPATTDADPSTPSATPYPGV